MDLFKKGVVYLLFFYVRNLFFACSQKGLYHQTERCKQNREQLCVQNTGSYEQIPLAFAVVFNHKTCQTE